MFYDLNIPCPFQPDRATADKIKLVLSQLSQSYECTAALTYTIQDVSKVVKPTPIDLSGLNSKYPQTIVKRAALDTDTLFSNEDIARLRQEYDLVSLKTRNRELFEIACSSLDLDIISFHFDERLSFELDYFYLEKAMERKVYFELCYSPTIRDKQTRLYTLQIAKLLQDCTKGKFLIISSGTELVSEIRGPFDIFYFAKSLGLPNDLAKFTVEKNCEKVLKRKNK